VSKRDRSLALRTAAAAAAYFVAFRLVQRRGVPLPSHDIYGEFYPNMGVAGEVAPGSVAFLRNDPERVTLRVGASERGFLVLSDSYFPGWRATIDDVETPIQRANYTFRLVEVPAGESVVEFRYAPRAPWIGAVVSAVTLLLAGLVLARPYVSGTLATNAALSDPAQRHADTRLPLLPIDLHVADRRPIAEAVLVRERLAQAIGARARERLQLVV
jgi:Bacterial membrane protein YfhO